MPNATSVAITDLRDPTAVGDEMELLDQDMISLDKKPFRVSRVALNLGPSALIFHSTSRRVRSKTKIHRNRIAFIAVGPQSRGTLDGLTIQPEMLFRAEPGVTVEVVVESGYRSLIFLISPAELGNQLRARGRGDEFHVPRGVGPVSLTTLGTRPFYRLGMRLIDAARRRPARFNDRAGARLSAHFELVELLLATLGTDGPPKRTRRDRTGRTNSRIVKTAETFALDHVDKHPFVSDLCEATGVSERTLQYAFKDILGLTPTAYLIRLRLHRARSDLRLASAKTTTVTEVALDWGFWHFGDFSKAYAQCFGELPSKTLRRNR